LKGSGYAFMADLIRSQFVDPFPFVGYRSAINEVKPSDQVEQGGLSGSIGADYAQYLVLIDFERNFIGGLQSAKSLGNIIYN
jgi:hypothetical protein